MNRVLRASLLGAVLVLGGAVALAQDPAKPAEPAAPGFDPKSTAQPGQYLPGPFHIFTVNGERQFKMHCPVCERYLHPTVGVFVRLKPGRPTGGGFNWLNMLDPQVSELLKRLEAMAGQRTQDKFGAFAAFLSLEKDILTDEYRDEVRNELEAYAKQNQLNRVTVGLAPMNDAQTVAYGLKDNVTVTVLVYDRLQVKARHEFDPANPLTAEKVEQILKEAGEMLPSVQAEARKKKK
jgi:hypothetical protein